MFEKLESLLAKGNYKEALYEFRNQYYHAGELDNESAAKLCILEASLWEGLRDATAEFGAISRGMKYAPTNYELFYMLGLYYRNLNVNKAYLCMEMAYFYCDNEDKSLIEETFNELKNSPGMRVRNVSIQILSYNDLEILKSCIEAIESCLPDNSFEVVVVDNASTQSGVREYLKGKRDSASYRFKLIESDENLGFPKGSNLGYKYCAPANDVLFLNNDAVLTPNALFYLRMGLYEDRNVGACSAMSNSASRQEIDPSLFEKYVGEELLPGWHKKLGFKRSLDIFNRYALDNSFPDFKSCIRRFRLTGFALLVLNDALKEVAPDGEVFDEQYSPGYFEDDDLGIRLAALGYRQYVCSNSFIYHDGGGGFEGHSDCFEINRERFKNKWGFDAWKNSLEWDEAVAAVIAYAKDAKRPLRILDFSCGLGANASFIKHALPESYVCGVCINSFAARIACTVADETAWGDLDTCTLPWAEHSFDVVIHEKESVRRARASQYLICNGIIINEDFLMNYCSKNNS